MSGVLYIVGTPIGNLEDITLRALRALKEADIVACEDTRHTRILLEHYGISCVDANGHGRLVRYDEHVHEYVSPKLVESMQNGRSIALVSNAGMPGVADPGIRLVRDAIGAGIKIVPVPGPSALCALSATGFGSNIVEFIGFLPRSRSKKRKILSEFCGHARSVVIFESPYRIAESLQAVIDVFGDVPVVLAREMTKIYEEFLRGQAVSVLEEIKRRGHIKGEITLVVNVYEKN